MKRAYYVERGGELWLYRSARAMRPFTKISAGDAFRPALLRFYKRFARALGYVLAKHPRWSVQHAAWKNRDLARRFTRETREAKRLEQEWRRFTVQQKAGAMMRIRHWRRLKRIPVPVNN